MENAEALKVVKEMATALDKARWALDAVDRNNKQLNEQRERINKLTQDIQSTERHITNNKRVIDAYEKKYGRHFEICRVCNGEGGGVIDMGEAGCDGWECEQCKGTGILELTPATT